MGDRFVEPQQQVTEENPDSVKKKKAASRVTSMDDFEITSKLGDGAYSSVYKVNRVADGDIYALKKVKLHHLSEKEKENAINEVRILASIKHLNIISYKEAFLEPQTQSLCIVMEYADNGDLFQKICDHQKNKTLFSENEIWKVFIQVVRGLKAMHDLNIMHRDLKSANVFLCKDFTAKLGDMNVSKVANKRGLNYTQTGTPYYASPEVWKDEPYDIKSDIWSLGCVLYEMIALKPPFTADDMQGLFKRVTKGHFPRIPKNFSHDLWTMVKYLIQVSPSSRPNCDQIMNIPTFAKKFEKLFPEEHLDNDQNILLKTIKFPKNLMYLSDRLPKQNYSNLRDNNEDQAAQGNDQRGTRKTQISVGNSKTYQQKDIRLPTIQNVKATYMNSVNLGQGNNLSYLSNQYDDSEQNNSMILAQSPYKKKQSGRSLQKPKLRGEDKSNSGNNTQNQSLLTNPNEETSKSPGLDDQSEISALNIQVGKKKHSLQHYTSLEVLNEEGQSKLTDKSETNIENAIPGIVLVASEKRIVAQDKVSNKNDTIFPPLNSDFENQQFTNSQDQRHVSPLLLKSKGNKKLKPSHHVVSISQDYQQQKKTNQNVSLNNNNTNNVSKVIGAYQMNPSRIMQNYQKQTISPPEKGLKMEISESQERLRASPQRVQEILNRYNLKQLKSNLKYGVVRGPKNNRQQQQYGKYYINQSYAGGRVDSQQPLLNNNSSVDLIIGTHMERNSKGGNLKEKNFSKMISDLGLNQNEEPQQSTLNAVRNNNNNAPKNQQQPQPQNNAYSVNNSNLVLPKLDNSFSQKHQQQIDSLHSLYKGSQQQSPRSLEKRQQKNRVMQKNKSLFTLLIALLYIGNTISTSTQCTLTKEDASKAYPSLIKCYRSNVNACCISAHDDQISKEMSSLLPTACQRKFNELELYYCYGCHYTEPQASSFNTTGKYITLCQDYAIRLWGGDLSQPSGQFDNCGMSTYWINDIDPRIIIPSLYWQNAYQFFAEVKPPFFEDYKILITSDPTADCFDNGHLIKIFYSIAMIFSLTFLFL